MNRAALKNYAPQARRAFIQAMTDRAAYYGLTANKIEPVVQKGDVAVIGGREHPRAVAKTRKLLEERIKRNGFEPTMEAIAYTWFNRLVAIRFMELHGYLEHGYRVLSHPEGKPTPEILEQAEHVALVGLKHDVIIDLKVAGNKESELYRLLLTAQCNALHTAMPFLFERIDDETELLLPDNLLHSESLIRKLVIEIEEQDWQQVEIIGWLYQFYISEKKDEVIGKVVASEDIPAATQLFTPNWIVKYLVQNTLGRQWLATYPQSALRQKMEYYIEPAEQTPEVQKQLKEITPTSLNPEELTLLDPACGSGHILVEAYDLFKAIYQERGYRAKDIPGLILQKNLFGLEIDDRAAQLAAFALMMKARADDRRIFDSYAQPNILAFEDSRGMNGSDITHALNSPINKDDIPSEHLVEEIQEDQDGLFSMKALVEKGHVSQADIVSLLDLFENAKTFGSLIQVPSKLAARLPEIERRLDDVLKHGDLTHSSARVLKPLLQQARFLARNYDAIVANPPYMGSKGLNTSIKQFGASHFPEGKADLFAMFMIRITSFATATGNIGLMTPFVWMFLQTYATLRRRLLQSHHISSLLQPEYHAFFESAFVPICAFTIEATPIDRPATFIRLTDFYGYDAQAIRTLEAIQDRECRWRYEAVPSQFLIISGSPIAYWIRGIENFRFGRVGDRIISGGRCKTHNDEKHVRFHWEVSRTNPKWKMYLKGGEFRRYYGNELHVVDWSDDARNEYDRHGGLSDRRFWEKKGITWSLITSALTSFRLKTPIAEYSSGSPTVFSETFDYDLVLLGYLNSSVASYYLKALNPTLNTTVNDVFSLPFKKLRDIESTRVSECVEKCIQLAQTDWDASELSWGFRTLSVLEKDNPCLENLQRHYDVSRLEKVTVQQRLEAEINGIFIEAFGLGSELEIDVPIEQITLTKPNRAEDIKRLLSYAVGCVMGRYSLDNAGLIYAHHGNQLFDAGRYKTFKADDDGITPLLETDWGTRDDAVERIVEFIGTAWPKEYLDKNLKFIAESLGPNNGEQSRDTIRRYLSNGFYKHHLSMYKKRPIYWLFSSGKHRAFQCLVYLHRYHEGTLARMRTEYVIPLQGQIAARIEQLEADIAKATSTSHRNKLQKEQTDLKKQQAELLIFEEKLKHVADQKITLDLNDGVKVNYTKFGDLLAESKAITGGKDDE